MDFTEDELRRYIVAEFEYVEDLPFVEIEKFLAENYTEIFSYPPDAEVDEIIRDALVPETLVSLPKEVQLECFERAKALMS